MSKIQGILLGAGFGTRLEPITKTLPKPLIPVLGIPLAEYILKHLAGFGIKDFHINTHHLADLFEKKIKELKPEGIDVSFSRENKILGTGGGIKKMIENIPSGCETAVISNMDAVYNFDLNEIIEAHKKGGASITVVLIPWKNGYSKVKTKNGSIINFGDSSGGKADKLEEGIFTGIHIFNPGALPPFPSRDIFCIVDDYYRDLLRKGISINAYFARNGWLDLGDIENYRKSSLEILKSPVKFSLFKDELTNYKEIEKNIYVHRKTNLPSKLKTMPPLLLAADVKIGNGTVLENSIIGEKSRIGENSFIKNSLFLKNSNVKNNSKIENSVFFGDKTLNNHEN